MNEERKEGYIKLFRKMINWEWFDDVNTCHLFLYCLLRANITNGSWHGIEYERGEFITSLQKLSAATGLTVMQVRTSLKKLKSTQEITCKVTSQNTIISIKNWDEYQVNNTQSNMRVTCEQHASNMRVTTDKNIKNIKNDKNEKNVYMENEQTKKSDPFIKSNIEVYFCEEYKKVFNNKPYILLNQRNKIMELNAGIENFKETIPPVLQKLKNLHFEGISNFTPNYIWLLTDDNYIKVLSGTFEKYKSAWVREMEAKGVDEYGN